MKPKSYEGFGIDPLLCLPLEEAKRLPTLPVVEAVISQVAKEKKTEKEADDFCLDILEMAKDHDIFAVIVGCLKALSIITANLDKLVQNKVKQIKSKLRVAGVGANV